MTAAVEDIADYSRLALGRVASGFALSSEKCGEEMGVKIIEVSKFVLLLQNVHAFASRLTALQAANPLRASISTQGKLADLHSNLPQAPGSSSTAFAAG